VVLNLFPTVTHRCCECTWPKTIFSWNDTIHAFKLKHLCCNVSWLILWAMTRMLRFVALT